MLELYEMEKTVGGRDWSCLASGVGLIAGALTVGIVTGGVGACTLDNWNGFQFSRNDVILWS